MLSFRPVNVPEHQEQVLHFFKSAATDPNEVFDEAEYIEFATQKSEELPEGFVFAEHDNQIVGELVLRTQLYEDRHVGYVSLIYVIPEGRGAGYAQLMFTYTEEVFRKLQLPEYHLRVDQRNARAVAFYEKQGLTKLAEERNRFNDLCWRMGKTL
ncbi:GNAT family N-acetyltransferase [Tumebacillus sp. ITR2]|uniref:GNAT family N-acetyltransferase n=1 Tax=Tumebacillus amylolyticus TaxID=2801339 RepID=A0ABS1J4X4_9BACL|nr:GNAT family N-acetyltransferase [Tumebacillus amylolyticus]MBL0385245.1 GNAT family N-acetyltransferase [Tumebacillus amylolyticus]